MSKIITKIVPLVGIGEIFASDIETDEVKLDNYQSAKVVVASNVAEPATTTLQVVAVLPDATEQEIQNHEITIGNNILTEIDIEANELAHYDATGVKIKIGAVADSTLQGGVAVILGNPRYAVEEDEIKVEESTNDATDNSDENSSVEDTTEPTEEVTE